MIIKKKKIAPLKEKWLQQFFAIAGNVAPVATINILVKLLFTPQKRSLKPAQVTCLHKATPFTIDVDEFKNPDVQLKLQCYSWGRGEQTILLVHGWEGRALDYYKMIPVLVASGYRVIGFDGPGHGNSEGERTNLVDFKEVMQQLIKKKIGVPYAIIGHSMGGGAAAFLLMDYDIRVKKFVAISIPTVSRRFFEKVFNHMKVPVKMQEAFFEGMAEQYHEYIDNYNLNTRKTPIQADEILMLDTEKDEVIYSKDTKDFLEKHPEVKHMEMKGTGHFGMIRNTQVIEIIREFLKN